MKNDRGFTLIELIVVMLIMAILAVGSVGGYNLLNRGHAKKVAERIITVLDYVQMENMTKSKSYTMQIEKDNLSGDYLLKIISKNSVGVIKEEASEILELSNGEIAFENNNLPMLNLVSSTEKLAVSFRKDTGGVKSVSGITVTRIKVTASGTSCYIRLVTTTGKHFIE